MKSRIAWLVGLISIAALTSGFVALGADAPEPPAPRTRAEVEAALGTTIEKNAVPIGSVPGKDSGELKPIKIVLLAGKKDHGPGEHDYPAWQAKWGPMFAKLPGVAVENAFGWPSAEQWRDANLVIAYYWNHEWSDEQLRQLDEYQARGGGLVSLHAASIHDHDGDVLAKRLGIAFEQPKMKWRHGELELQFWPSRFPDVNRIGRLIPRTISFHDETYWLASGENRNVHILAVASEEEKSWPMLWTYAPEGKGRVFGCVLGHYSWTFDDPLFRLIVLRSAAWAADQPLERFQSLATDGVRFAEDSKH
jgi:type 1 glutamine amidotransferase